MGMGTVKPLQLSNPAFLKRVRSIAADSHRVVLTKHAKLRMRQRYINLGQVLDCLRNGTISEPAHLDVYGNWKATLERQSAGDVVKVAVALEKQEDGDLAVVVTVMD